MFSKSLTSAVLIFVTFSHVSLAQDAANGFSDRYGAFAPINRNRQIASKCRFLNGFPCAFNSIHDYRRIFFTGRQHLVNNLQSEANRIKSQKYSLYFRLITYLGYGHFSGELEDALQYYFTLSLGMGIRYKRYSIDFIGDLGAAKLNNNYVGRLILDPLSDTTRVKLVNTGFRVGMRALSTKRLKVKPFIGLAWNRFASKLVDKPGLADKYKCHHQFGIETNVTVGKTGKAREMGGGVQHSLYCVLIIGGWNLDSVEFGKGNLIAIYFGYLADIALF